MKDAVVSMFNNERRALHKALIEIGFVHSQTNGAYFYHSTAGDLVLRDRFCTSFDAAVRNLGGRLFSANSPYVQKKLAYSISQKLLGHAGTFQCLQVASTLSTSSDSPTQCVSS
jgi:hypothetical protein